MVDYKTMSVVDNCGKLWLQFRGMPRPRKDGRLRMDTDLRIPLTSEQKSLIDNATRDEPEGKAAWARAILLEAARKRLRKERQEESR